MGVVQTKPRTVIALRNSLKINNNKAQVFNPTNPEPDVTEEDAILLRNTWSHLKDEVSKVGVVTFINLFETHPEVQDAFMPFRTLKTTELEYSTIMRSHAMRVMSTVDKCIARLDSRQKLQEMLIEMGIRHQNYRVKIEFIDLMGPQFILSIKPHLEADWSVAYERAWDNLFKFMAYYMKKGICSI